MCGGEHETAQASERTDERNRHEGGRHHAEHNGEDDDRQEDRDQRVAESSGFLSADEPGDERANERDPEEQDLQQEHPTNRREDAAVPGRLVHRRGRHGCSMKGPWSYGAMTVPIAARRGLSTWANQQGEGSIASPARARRA